MGAESPQRIGRYELLEELGRGMMGVVYRAHDSLLHRVVALKTIQLTLAISEADQKTFEERFFVEARSAARLSHPGIVIVHDIGRDPESGTLYMALEYLKGRTLAQMIADDAPLPWQEAVRITARVAEALGHAHSEGVVHRDIKPANIMLLESGEPKLMDFGIAKLATSTTRLTSTGQFFGTPLFMAPEQALGQTVDGRSDLFSLATVAYELLTAKRPFEADNVPRILARVAYESPPPPTSLVASLPSAIDGLIARALAKHPEDRYPTGQALAEDLDDVLAGQPPRHMVGWQPRPAGAETQIAGPGQAAPPLPTPSRAGSATASVGAPAPRSGADWDSPEAALSSLQLSVRPERRRRRGRFAAVSIVGLALISALGFGVGYWLTRDRAPRAAAATPSRAASGAAAPAPSTAPAPTTTQPAARPTPTPTPVPTATPEPTPTATPKPAVKKASLSLDFEHHLESGVIKLWIDRKLVLEKPISGEETRKLPGLKLHKGYFEDQLELAAGFHDIWVEVRWDDNIKSSGISAGFRAGTERRLRIRVGRIRKNVSLKWM